jgi:hypothetical protein
MSGLEDGGESPAPAPGSTAGSGVRRRFSLGHTVIFLGFAAAFLWLNDRAQLGVTPGNGARPTSTPGRTVLLTVAGPLAGGIIRDYQACCWKASLALLPYCAGILAAGAAVQFLPLPRRNGFQAVRLVAWFLGLTGWFGGAVLSYGHALS